MIACGALALDVQAIARRRHWDVEIVPVDAFLHNRPERIAPAVDELRARHDVVALAYADCGTYGALDELGLPRLAGDHCYDVFAGHDQIERLRDEQPGTYFLTDFLARTFAAHGRARARARPLPGAARRLLPPLHPRGVAGAAADAGDAALRASAPPRRSGCRWR